MKRIRPLATALMTLSFLVAAPALAQTAGQNPLAADQTAPPPGTVNCSDYYHFQSVQVSFGATNTDTYEPGDLIHFKGSVTNQNSYPVVNGDIFARISRKDPHYLTEGNYIVDEFIPFSNVDLAANEKKDLSFTWPVPADLTAGDYQIDFFFTVGKKFYLGGLPFTNEVTIGSTDFKIVSQNTSAVSFDRAGTTVNGQKYQQIGNWPVIAPNARVSIVQPLDNTYSTPQKATVQYDLYFWDSLNPADKISSETEQVTIPANGSVNLKYAIPQMKEPEYLLKITATTPSQKSIINLRVVSSPAHPQLNFPAITQFPLQKGERETLFSCFYNAGSGDTNGTLSVVLQDQKGDQIGNLEYKGTIIGAMLAAKKDFAVQNNYTWLKLIATVKDSQGKVTDQYQTVYDCAKINSPACRALLAKEKTAAGQKAGPALGEIVTGIIVVLVIISLGFIIWKKRGAGQTIKILAFLAVGASLFLTAPQTHASYNDQTVTVTPPNPFSYQRRWGSRPVRWTRLDVYASIQNRVGMTTGNYTVTAGSPIDFAYEPDPPYFFATGQSGEYGSPYGAWCSSLSPNFSFSNPCGGSWYQVHFSVGGMDAVDVTAVRPGVYMTSSNPGVISCSGMNCTAQNVSSPQTATLTANIPAISGQYWYKQLGWNEAMAYPANFGASSLSWTITVEPNRINGTCGSANGGTFSSAPTINFCNSGSFSGLSGSGPWTWTCRGANGGSTAYCKAYSTPISGACGSANGGTFSFAPTVNLCNSGTFSGLSGTGPWTWICDGLNGGLNSPQCSANLLSPPTYFCQSICSSSDCGVTRQEACWEDNNGTLSSVSQSNCNSGTGCPTETCNAGCSVTNNNDWKEVAP